LVQGFREALEATASLNLRNIVYWSPMRKTYPRSVANSKPSNRVFSPFRMRSEECQNWILKVCFFNISFRNYVDSFFFNLMFIWLGIYVNKNLRLDKLQVYGFDYDYTLAHYSSHLQTLIYDLAKEYLVDEVSSDNALLLYVFMTLVPFLTRLVASFSLGIRRFAWVLNMIQLSPLEACTMIR